METTREQLILQLTRDYMIEDTKLSAVEARKKAIDKADWIESTDKIKPIENRGLVGVVL